MSGDLAEQVEYMRRVSLPWELAEWRAALVNDQYWWDSHGATLIEELDRDMVVTLQRLITFLKQYRPGFLEAAWTNDSLDPRLEVGFLEADWLLQTPFMSALMHRARELGVDGAGRV